MRAPADSDPLRLDGGVLEPAPIERAETLPSRFYVEPDFHRADLAWVLGRRWQYVGPASRVARPGDTLLATVAGEPVLVVRGEDRALRAFFNVCRHRGGPLALKDGSCRVLKCRYHGWTYRLDGSLLGLPKWDRVELFDKGEYGLIPVRVREWQALLFAHVGDGEPEPLERVLDGIPGRIAPYRLDTKRFERRVEYEIRCNWKVYVDNYLEGYHIPHVHPELAKFLDYQSYETELRKHYSLQTSPIRADENFYDGTEGRAFYYFVFPNFMLNILPGRLQTNVVLAGAPDRCRVIFDYYYDRPDDPSVREMIAQDLEYADRVQAEDIEICERVQLGLGSRAYDRGRFSVECEAGVHHFQECLKRAYRER